MKNDFKKIYWTVVIIWGTLASICSLLYAVFFESNAGLAQLFWNLSYWSVVILIMISIVSALGFALGFIIKGFISIFFIRFLETGDAIIIFSTRFSFIIFSNISMLFFI